MNRRTPRRIFSSLLLLCVAAALVAGAALWPRDTTATEPSVEVSADMTAAATGNTEFALDLYKKLAASDELAGKNLFYSPYSISTALAMTYAGARGETAAEMASTLRFAQTDDALHTAMGALSASLVDNDAYEMAIANRLWGEQSMAFESPFLELLDARYGAGLETVDFRSDANGARKIINDWVEQQTKGKIQELLRERTVDASTRLVLTNAVYFKGQWKQPFSEGATTELPFERAASDYVQVPQMHQTAEYHYAEVDGVQLLQMPYAGDRLAMTIALPEPGKLDALEKTLDAETVTGWLDTVRRRKVEVFLPRFEATTTLSLADTLEAMGMPLAFGMGADFSGMTTEDELMISAVEHKAFVEVNEEGTEAAAATAVVMSRKGASKKPEPPPIFRADHPFVFFIHDQETGSILFAGRIMDPT